MRYSCLLLSARLQVFTTAMRVWLPLVLVVWVAALRFRLFGRLNVCCLALLFIFVLPIVVGFASSFSHNRNCSTQAQVEAQAQVCWLMVSSAVLSWSLPGGDWVVPAAMGEEIVSLPLSLSGKDEDASVGFSKDEVDLSHNIFTDPDKFLTERSEKHRKKQEQRAGERPLFEGFIGTDITENQIGSYAGGVTGLLDDYNNLKGVRLRAVYGQGVYRYQSSRLIGGQYEQVDFRGTSEFWEVMAGYEFRFSGSIFKLYGGAVFESNDIDPFDRLNSLEGQKVGGKVLLEAWRDLEGGHWLSAYGSYSEGSGYYTVHGRYGLPLHFALDAGLEFGAFGNQEFDALRLGAFARIKDGDQEWTFSAGISGDYDQPDSVYGTVQYFRKFYSSDVLAGGLFD